MKSIFQEPEKKVRLFQFASSRSLVVGVMIASSVFNSCFQVFGCRRELARDAMAKLVTSVAYSFSLPFSVVLFINSSPVTCARSAGVSAAGLPKQLSGLSISSLLALSLG